jgi:hypothetical protein
VVNLDGFNEAALGGLNVEQGLDTSMPSAIHLRSLSVLASSPNDIESLRYRVALADLDLQDLVLAERQAVTNSAGLWMLAELRRHRAAERRRRLADSPPAVGGSSPPVALTPPLDGELGAELPVRIAADWERASRLMSAIASQAGAHYLHVLQPNQYVGDRVFSPRERRLAIHPRSPYVLLARAGYPALKEAGARLTASGIPYRDATGVFDATEEVVYADDCCHFNQRGNDLLAEFVFEAMAELIRRDGVPAADGGRSQP